MKVMPAGELKTGQGPTGARRGRAGQAVLVATVELVLSQCRLSISAPSGASLRGSVAAGYCARLALSVDPLRAAF